MMLKLLSSQKLSLSYKVPIRICLIIFWIGSSGDHQGTNAAHIPDDKIWLDALLYFNNDDNTDNRGGLVEENQQRHLQQSNDRPEGQEIPSPSLWNEEYDVWGSMHLEQELGSGWTPASFPNPEFDPDSCGISPVLRGGSGSGGGVNLYLCDPDRVVSGRDFGRLAASLRNFTAANGGGGAQDIDDPKTSRSHLEHFSEDINFNSLRRRRGLMASLQHQQPQPQPQQQHQHVNDYSAHATDDFILKDLDESYDRELLVLPKTESNFITRRSGTHTLDNLHTNESGGLPDGGQHLRYRAEQNDVPATRLGSFLPRSPHRSHDISVGIAIAQKIDVTDILREYSFYSFENEVETIDDAAEYFARYLLNLWWATGKNEDASSSRRRSSNNRAATASGVLIFMSVEERVCFISAGKDVSYILPWWRLENIVDGMKTNLRNGNYGDALLSAINEVSAMLDSGPPTTSERVQDFLTRFGFVIAFSLLTFLLALGGEYRDRRKRLSVAETRSRLNIIELEKAKLLQCEFKAIDCPICLEPFINENSRLVQTDTYGIPLYGSDGLPIKMLRCGHIYDVSCWRAWIDVDFANSRTCPVCRQDVAGLEYNSIHSTNRSSSSFYNPSNNSISDSDLSVSAHESISLSYSTDAFDYESAADIPINSYGSTWTSTSENRNWDLLLLH